ncbi:MAG: four helix bundle protein [Bacillota bacterium]|nr:four helix bundle protein [Bacillota bacterium]
MKENLVYEKAFKFAVKIVGIYRYLVSDKKEYILSKQLLCSGTSIGANIKEAIEGQSTKDFLSKMNIALKEASETEYWLYLLRATGYFDEAKHNSIIEDCIELNRILNSIVKTMKKKCLDTSS